MEVTPGSSFVVALCSCLYILTISCPGASGKCRGSWAIHACFGGNGKRSSLPSAPAPASPTHRHRQSLLDKVPPTTLRQMLVTDLVNLQTLLQNKHLMEEQQPSVQFPDLSDYTRGSLLVTSPRQSDTLPVTSQVSDRQLTAPVSRAEKLDKLRNLLRLKSSLREEELI